MVTEYELQRHFPNASKSCVKANAQDGGGLQAPKPERPVCHAPVEKVERKEEGTGRFSVHIESRRTRLLDPDNCTTKFLVDCLRHAGILPDDSAKYVSHSVSQTKVKKGEECTVITVEEI